MDPPEERWIDDEAGPIVRPFAVIQGRTQPAGDTFDLMAVIRTTGRSADPALLEPEHKAIMRACHRPIAVVDLSFEVDLPLGVVRVLLGDLRDQELIWVNLPPAPGARPDDRTLREVINGLRRL
jgi:hypothetical protein